MNYNTSYTPAQILSFWYDEKVKKQWFNSSGELDITIRHMFETLVHDVLEEKLKSWTHTAEGVLASIIVLDQFPLNIYRGKKESFSGEQQAVKLALKAIELKYDEQLNHEQLIFLFMPFMHSEHIEHQDLAVSYYTKYDMQENLQFAQHHRNIIKRFGRFPHRNQILGRENTLDEKEYLSSKKAFRG